MNCPRSPPAPASVALLPVVDLPVAGITSQRPWIRPCSLPAASVPDHEPCLCPPPAGAEKGKHITSSSSSGGRLSSDVDLELGKDEASPEPSEKQAAAYQAPEGDLAAPAEQQPAAPAAAAV